MQKIVVIAFNSVGVCILARLEGNIAAKMNDVYDDSEPCSMHMRMPKLSRRPSSKCWGFETSSIQFGIVLWPSR